MNRMQRILFLFLIISLALPVKAQAASAQRQPASLHTVSAANGVRTLSSTEDETLFEVSAGSYRLEAADSPDGPCQRVVMEGYEAAGEPGAPELPLRTLLLGLPPGASPVVSVVSEEISPMIGGVRLCAALDAVIEETEENDGGVIRYVEQAVAQDPAVYAQNALLPVSPVRVVDQGYMGRLAYVRLEIAPFQYNPAEGTLLHRSSMQVRVEHRGTGVQAATNTAVDDTFMRSVWARLSRLSLRKRLHREAPQTWVTSSGTI